MENSIAQIDKFFKAESVAVIGASSIHGKIGYEVARSLSQYDYKGRVYPINPNVSEILGLKCYPTVLAVPDKIDLAIFTLSSRFIPALLDECGRKGIKNIIIISGGFKEMGREFAPIEDEVIRIARKYRMRVIGPNCIGVFDSKTKLDTFFHSHERMSRPRSGPIAFITQSGTFGCTILEWASETSVGISKFVSYGNRCDVDEADLIGYLRADRETKVIVVYLEGIQKGRKLLDAARQVLPNKPIVVLKAGRTEKGSKATLTHTGWLGGSYEICKSAFKQTGIIVADNIEELFDMAKALAMQPAAEGNRVAMVTNGMGPVVMAIDACVECGMEIGRYSKQTLETLRKSLPSYCNLGLAVDLTGSATSREFEITMNLLLKDPIVNILMVFFVFQDTLLDEKIIDVTLNALRHRKPVICCASGGHYTLKQSRLLENGNVPVYPTPERAVAAAHALVLYGTNRKKGDL